MNATLLDIPLSRIREDANVQAGSVAAAYIDGPNVPSLKVGAQHFEWRVRTMGTICFQMGKVSWASFPVIRELEGEG
jgi:hypothetical protein